MPHKRTVSVLTLIVISLVGTIAVRLAAGASAIPAVAAQPPTIGPTNTAAAETAQAGVTAITASDAPPTPTPLPTPPPLIPPTPALRATPVLRTSPAPTSLSSSGSAIAPATPAASSSSAGGSNAWPVVITLAVIAIIVAAGIGGARFARGRSSRR